MRTGLLRQLQKHEDKLIMPPVPTEHLIFHSLSEFACAKMLEKYARWEAIQGATFQIKIGNTSFDFLIGNTLVEYHPISLKHEFSKDNLSEILSAMHKMKKSNRDKIFAALKNEFATQYTKRRRQVAAASVNHANLNVLCVFSPEEFIQKVIFRFSSPRLANRTCTKNLVAEFKQMQKEAKKNLA